MTDQVHIIGAGICGCLLSIRLQQRGYQCHVFERRPDYRKSENVEGISINLALSARGLDAVERVGDQGLLERVKGIIIPMYGRMVRSVGMFFGVF